MPKTTGTHAPIPPSRWGRDHARTLIYIETRAVDYSGNLNRGDLHLDRNYPTRLRDGSTVDGHVETDRIADLEAAGLIRKHANGHYELTPAGWYVAGKLRQHYAETSHTIGRGLGAGAAIDNALAEIEVEA